MLEFVMENFALCYLIGIVVFYVLEMLSIGLFTSTTTDDAVGNPVFIMAAILWIPCLILSVGIGIMLLIFMTLYSIGIGAFKLGESFRRK